MHNVSRETGYYLPLSYNDNKIVLLVRDPQWLYAYWEVSGEKYENFISQFGEQSWNNSQPVIKLTNITTGNVEYIYINDYARSWFIEVNQPNSTFSAELGRLFSHDLFVTLSTSNSVHTPTNKVSDNTSVFFANYRDLKTMKRVEIKTDLGKYEASLQTAQQPEGLSSAELSGMGPENFGVSSESFIK